MEVAWTGGGLWIRSGDEGVLIDAPAGGAERLGLDVARVTAVVLTSGAPRSVAGLIPLFCALDHAWLAAGHHDRSLPLFTTLGEERGAALADAWARAWPGHAPVVIDAMRAGGRFSIGALDLTTIALRSGEPTWPDGEPRAALAVAVRVEGPGGVVVFVPPATPSTAVARACVDADLAVVMVGVLPWLPSEQRWRPTASEAAHLASGAKSVWLAGDDGTLLGGEDQ